MNPSHDLPSEIHEPGAGKTPASPSQANSSLPHILERVQAYLVPLETLGRQRVTWIGSILLFIGVFLPAKAVSIPFIGVTVAASFWDFAKAESLLLLVCALASGALAYIRDYRWLWATGITAFVVLVIEFFNALTQAYVHPGWGWVVLFPGVVLVVAGAAMKRDPAEASGDAASIVTGLVKRASAVR